MEWKDIAGAIGSAAPILGTLIGGPAGGAVGGLIASALGTKPTPDDVAAALKDPDAVFKLRQLEAEKEVRLKELLVDQAKAEMAARAASEQTDANDRADARRAQVQLHSRMPGVLAVVVTLGFFGVVGLMLAGVWKPNDNNALLLLLGSLGTSWGAIVNFYFGSSASSARKDALLVQQPPPK